MNQEDSLKNTFLLGGDSFTLPKCMVCKHYKENNNASFACEAFPEGIPDDVLWEEEDKECNNGIKFNS